MLPLIIAAVVVISVVAIVALYRGPTKQNNTVNIIESRLDEEDIAERKRKNDQETEDLKKERERVEEMEANSKKRHEQLMRMMLQTEQRAKENTDRKVQDGDKRKMKKEQERAARQKNEEEARELARQVEELKAKEQRLEAEVEKVNQMAERQRAARVAEDGFAPLRWPTREEFQQALQATQYDPVNFHFAIVGRAGSGKSSLINAFRNLRNKEPGAAPTGTSETTLEVKRYKDPGEQPPRQWMVWFDVPGAGTQRIPHHDYFIKQGLFVFDLIILAIGDRFEEIDVRILENCARFKIPAFIVRSKADMHILNSMKEYGDYDSINGNPALYKKCRDTFIAETQQTVTEGLVRQDLPDQHVYIVSRDELQRTYSSSLKFSGGVIALTTSNKGSIHEAQLTKELLTAATQRRCDNIGQAIDWAKDKYLTAQENLINFSLGGLGLASSPAVPQESQQSRVISPGVPDTQHIFPAVPDTQHISPAVPDTQQQRIYQDPRDNRKVIYPYQETSAEELYDEMTKHDPELSNMLVGNPRMFTSRVAMLTFYPLAPIPDRVYAFGAWLRVEEYIEKEKKKGVGRGGHTQTTEDKKKTGEGYKGNTASARGSINRGRGGRGGRGGSGKGRGEAKRGFHQRPVTPPPEYW